MLRCRLEHLCHQSLNSKLDLKLAMEKVHNQALYNEREAKEKNHCCIKFPASLKEMEWERLYWMDQGKTFRFPVRKKPQNFEVRTITKVTTFSDHPQMVNCSVNNFFPILVSPEVLQLLFSLISAIFCLYFKNFIEKSEKFLIKTTAIISASKKVSRKLRKLVA